VGTVRSSAREALRHAALDALSVTGRVTGRAERHMRRPRVHFLYLHAVPVAEIPTFQNLVARVAEHHELVPYSKAVAMLAAGEPARPTVTFSFDDGFASNLGAARVLEDFGTTGCFFVPTGFVGCRTLSEARQFYGMSEGVDEIAMTWRDLESLVGHGHEIGNHTVQHRAISRLSEFEVYDEIAHARQILKSRLGQGEHFAWPWGRFGHFTAHAARVVFDTGHASCASAERGAHLTSSSSEHGRQCIHRDHLMTSWPLRHNLHFVSAGAKNARTGAWPEGWAVS